jgi:hypothetical protein
MSNSAHSNQWDGTSSRARRKQRKLGKGIISLDRLNQLLRPNLSSTTSTGKPVDRASSEG